MSRTDQNLINPLCPLCGNGNFQPLYLINTCEIARCRECQLIYTRRIPAWPSDKFSYEEDYFQNPAFKNSDLENLFGYDIYLTDLKNLQEKFQTCLKIITRYQPSGKLLDIGCAAGIFLDLARQHRFEVLGLEPSRFASRKARELFGVTVIPQELREADLPAAGFDVVTLWDVIEHFSNPRAELREIERVLKPGGILGIITPNIGSLAARILKDKWLEIRRMPEHLVFFSTRTLKRLLEETGFEILETHTVGKKFYLDSFIRNLNFQLRTFDLPALPVPRFHLRIPFSINPRYKIFLLARKTEKADNLT